MLTKPELCQVCATGHDRVHCIYAPVPCEDRIGLWEGGAAAERVRIWKQIDTEARALHRAGDTVNCDTLFGLSERIREGVWQ